MKTRTLSFTRLPFIWALMILSCFVYRTEAQDVYCATADFTTTEKENGIVEFTGTSDKPVLEWYWYFGDQNTSREINPTHTYLYAGEYEVCLKVLVADSCTGAVCKTIRVEKGALGGACNLDIDFKHEINGLMLTAKGWSNANQNAARYTWKFGDNNTGEGTDVRHTFAEKGTYTVCLTVTLPTTTASDPICSETICKTIKIGETGNPCDLKADFKFDINGLILTAKGWTNHTSPGARYSWKFGDNTTGDGQDVRHEYTQKGEYNVCLTVTIPATTSSSPLCSQTICKTLKIGDINNPCDLKADFTFALSGNIVKAMATSNAGNGARYIWKISDGTTAEGLEIKHQFEQRGEYEICLVVTKPAVTATQNCSVTVCKKITIGQNTTDEACPLKADFRYTRSLTGFGFHARSNDPDAEYTWTIEGLNATFTGKDVRIPLSRPGVYTVCLTVSSRSFGCRTQVCKRIVIGRSSGVVSPNPATDYTRVSAEQAITSFLLFDSKYNQVDSGLVFQEEINLDVSHLIPGVYYLMITLEDGSTSVEKIIKL